MVALDVIQVASFVKEVLTTTNSATTTPGQLVVKETGKARLEKLFLTATFEVPMGLEKSATTSLLGAEVPGRRLSVRAEATCRVRCELDLSRVKVEKDPEDPGSVTVVLPEFELSADFGPGEEAVAGVEYGSLRFRYFNRTLAEELRQGMYREARARAIAEIAGESLPTYRKEIARQLEKQLCQQLGKGVRVRVRW
jgi:hypothetical protein